MRQRSEKIVTRLAVVRVTITTVVVMGLVALFATTSRAAPAGAAYLESPGWTLIATPTHSTLFRASPTGRDRGAIESTWHGQRLFTPVVARRGDWIEVRRPGRPNGSTGWITRRSVSFEVTPYAIVVDLTTRHLLLYKAGRLVLNAPAGVGTARDPTPTGHFFLGFFAASPGPSWGPFVIVTTAHSNRITDWEDSGDALIAIHGPLGADHQIGTKGAAVSHGCIRLHVADLMRLRKVPDGTPITIIAGP